MKERCATVMQALASIRSVEEITGFTEGLRKAEGAKPVTEAEWAAIARRKIELMRAV